jgi:hypothetical protein
MLVQFVVVHDDPCLGRGYFVGIVFRFRGGDRSRGAAGRLLGAGL